MTDKEHELEEEDLQIVEVEESSKPKRDIAFILDKIEQKIDRSPVLNGGFESLVIKLDNLSEKQDDTAKKVDNIHESIFHPPDGLQYKFLELKNYSDSLKEKVTKEEQKQEELTKEQQKLNSSVQPIIQLKRKLDRLMWILIPILLSTVAKIIWDLAKGH